MAEGLQTGFLTDVLLPVSLAVIMLGMGMSLTGADFRRVARTPLAAFTGLGAQVLLLPPLAVLVALAFRAWFGMSEPLLLGLLLVACCPAGTTSNVAAYLARADAALSVSMTGVSSLASAFTTPLTFLLATRVVLGRGSRVEVSFAEMAALVAAIVVLPILLGMLVRRARPAWALRADRPFRAGSVLFMFLVIGGVIYENRADFWGLAARAVPSALALNLLALGAGLAVGAAVRLRPFQARAISLEVAFQNGTLGIALAVSQLDSAEAAIVPGFYALLMFVSGGLVAWAWARDAARRPEQVGFPGLRRIVARRARPVRPA